MKKAYQDNSDQHSQTWKAKTPSWATEPSKFSREERQVWQRWNDDPNGAKPHRNIGSRNRPISIASSGASVDELFEQMVAKGIVAAPPKSRGRK